MFPIRKSQTRSTISPSDTRRRILLSLLCKAWKRVQLPFWCHRASHVHALSFVNMLSVQTPGNLSPLTIARCTCCLPHDHLWVDVPVLSDFRVNTRLLSLWPFNSLSTLHDSRSTESVSVYRARLGFWPLVRLCQSSYLKLHDNARLVARVTFRSACLAPLKPTVYRNSMIIRMELTWLLPPLMLYA